MVIRILFWAQHSLSQKFYQLLSMNVIKKTLRQWTSVPQYHFWSDHKTQNNTLIWLWYKRLSLH